MGDKNQSGGSIAFHNSGECGMFRDCNFLPIYLSLRLCIILRIHLTMKGEKMGCNMMRENMFVQCYAFRS